MQRLQCFVGHVLRKWSFDFSFLEECVRVVTANDHPERGTETRIVC
jgi:hypothetical protein